MITDIINEKVTVKKSLVFMLSGMVKERRY